MLDTRHPYRLLARPAWYTPGARIESLLFVAVQAAMLACTVLVGAQLLAVA